MFFCLSYLPYSKNPNASRSWHYKTPTWVLSRNLWCLLFTIASAHDGLSRCQITIKVDIFWRIAGLCGWNFVNVSWWLFVSLRTGLFVVEQDGVPSGKSFQYPCGALYWYVNTLFRKAYRAQMEANVPKLCLIFCGRRLRACYVSMLTLLNEFCTAGDPALAS